MVRIILVRHGETQWNIEGRYQGREDTHLSERGLKQGQLLARGLKDVHIDAFISSPLERAFMTASFCAELHGEKVQKDPRLTEIDHGDWEGRLAGEIEAAYPREFAAWHTAPHTVQMPGAGGESLADVCARARAAFDDYATRWAGKTVLAAAHDAVNKALICDLLGMSQKCFWQIKQDNACINVLEEKNGLWRLVLLNSTNHLGYLFSGIEQKGL
ncbi:histidine phosphatase family protein [Anaeroglobus geminatus]|jgi:broad specificity phosphatase PhoE|uniref:Phosphoglycerate mutase family protein n=1 Tax=Anaeroglobus geminatus F0357 TaxID=861450 RepID=G9YF38_9FIRM|nr:histidine phosphatase family protein [Anaeroglobus geminatus]EHM43373.1 phosphoglycerate mutase family protein [Anaeroglobus geminatus F0357]